MNFLLVKLIVTLINFCPQKKLKISLFFLNQQCTCLKLCSCKRNIATFWNQKNLLAWFLTDKNDHVISWNKDLLSQVSWLEKKANDFSTFPLISAEMILNLWNIHGSNEMTSLNNIISKRYLFSFIRKIKI